ncbi:MAG TPA: hypothetical protein VJW94_06465, partial [Candidatus Acidoferrum sp.]|nr:hypothetical protein [Candidatus Acidoferrum sp.]
MTSYPHADSQIYQARSPHPTVHLFHHIRAVSTITDSIPMPCKNHSQIAAAKRVPASRGGQTLFDI